MKQLLACAALVAAACSSTPPPAITPQPCPTTGPAVQAAQKARAVSPTSYLRGRYLSENAWDLFDVDKDDRLTWAEYQEMSWASWLSMLEEGRCTFTLQQYLDAKHPPLPEGADQTMRNDMLRLSERSFHELDRGHKGYITRSDIGASRWQFNKLDLNNDRVLTRGVEF